MEKITPEEYKKAKEVVNIYQKQILESEGTPCWILSDTNHLHIVVLNEENAKNLYDTGNYIMIKSQLYESL